MSSFNFQMVFSRPFTENEVDALYEAGFDGSAVGEEDGVGVIDVCWKASTMSEARARASRAVLGAISTISITRIKDIDA